MTTNELIKTCKDYNVSKAELEISSAVELLSLDNKEEGLTMEGLIQNMRSVVGVKGLLRAIKWARWVKHAKLHNKPGKNVAELLEMRK